MCPGVVPVPKIRFFIILAGSAEERKTLALTLLLSVSLCPSPPSLLTATLQQANPCH
jgi:hypothetical protein